MSANLNLVWVRKTRDSSSLSNCRAEKGIFHQIRSHAVSAGHKSSRVKRPVKRMPLELSWTQRRAWKTATDDIRLQSSRQKCRDNVPLLQEDISQPKTCTPCSSPRKRQDSLLPLPADKESSSIFTHVSLPAPHPLSTRHDPFSSYSISLEVKATLEAIYYFQHIWTQCAFKLPGCVGYGQSSISQREVTAIIQQSLTCPTRAYCLLAGTSARKQYLHYPAQSARMAGHDQEEAHKYAAKALHGLRRRMDERREWEEEEATEVLFIAAYEMFCEDEVAAGKHLVAVRRLYKMGIENIFVKPLQANLEVLVAKNMNGG